MSRYAYSPIEEGTHPAIFGNPDRISTIMHIRWLGYYDGCQFPERLRSERELTRLMADKFGCTPEYHRKRLRILREAGVYSFQNGIPVISLVPPVGTTLGPDVGTMEPDVGTLEPDVGTMEPDVGTLGPDVGTTLYKTPGQATEIGPTISGTVRTERTAEQAADAAGAEEGVKMATLGADPDRTWSDRRPAKPWRKSKTREPETRHESRTNQYPANCSRCGKNLPAGQGEYLGKDAEGKPIVKCLTRCEDILGKKAKREAQRKLLQAQIESIALAQGNEKFRNALFDLKAALDTKQHLYDTYDELAKASYPHIEAWFGADAYQFAYETLKEYYS